MGLRSGLRPGQSEGWLRGTWEWRAGAGELTARRVWGAEVERERGLRFGDIC